MAMWKLFEGRYPHVSTAEFHAHRERANHLDDPVHRPRLDKAAEYVRVAAHPIHGPSSLSDLGCGDGGLLSLITKDVDEAWGYDFCPANAEGWAERGVKAELLDVFDEDSARVRFGTITVVTEVLEHLADPIGVSGWIAGHSRFVVASSPWMEGPWGFDECHAWAWDPEGYRSLIEHAGYHVLRHEKAGNFQVILGVKL